MISRKKSLIAPDFYVGHHRQSRLCSSILNVVLESLYKFWEKKSNSKKKTKKEKLKVIWVKENKVQSYSLFSTVYNNLLLCFKWCKWWKIWSIAAYFLKKPKHKLQQHTKYYNKITKQKNINITSNHFFACIVTSVLGVFCCSKDNNNRV